ncbi:MAG: extracellular solute-binding protein [Nitrososphaeria archaeon]
MSQEPKKVDRRNFIYAGLGAVALIAIGAAAYVAMNPPVVTQTTTVPTTISTTSIVTTTVPTTITTTKPGAPVVRVLHVAGPEADHIRACQADFEKATGLTLSLEIAPRDVVDERMYRELLEGLGAYDVVMGWAGMMYTTLMATEGYIPIDNFMSAKELEPFYAKEQYTWKGHVVGIPQYHNWNMLFYRKDLLEDPNERAAFKAKYGRELTVPKTFKELYEVAEFFHRPPNMYGYLITGVEWSWFCDMVYFMHGMSTNVGNKAGDLTLNTPEMIKAWKYMLDMTKFSPPGWESMTFFDGDSLIQQGKLFMYNNWFYIWVTLLEKMGPQKIGMAPPPGDIKPGADLSGWLAVIPKSAPSPERGATFIKWLASYEYQKRHVLEVGNMPSRSDVFDDPEVKAKVVGLDAYKQVLPHAEIVYTTWLPELRSGLYEGFFKVVKGEMSVENALRWLQEEKFKGRRAIEVKR